MRLIFKVTRPREEQLPHLIFIDFTFKTGVGMPSVFIEAESLESLWLKTRAAHMTNQF